MEQSRISAPQGTQPAHAARAKTGKPDAQAGDTAAPGGFGALLATAAPQSPADDAAQPGAGSSRGVPVDQADADARPDAAAMAWQGLLPPGAAERPELLAASASGAGTMDRTAGHGFGNAGLGPAGAAPDSGRLPCGLVAQTALLDSAADVDGGPQPVNAAGTKAFFTRMQSVLGRRADAADAGVGKAGATGAAPVHQAGNALSAALGAAPCGVNALGAPADAAQMGAARGPAVAELAQSGAVSALEEPAAAATPSGGSQAGGGGRGVGNGQASGAVGLEGAPAGSPQETAAADGATAYADPAQATAGAEEQIAEQVAYWIHQKTQNAELTLRRDGQPVEVSVSLSGNEAHVSFRSDQAQTRELLDRSMAQLGELLRSEGLVLSGMSVGTHGAQGDGARQQQQRQRDGARQAKVLAAAPAGTPALGRVGSASGRAVDIFV